MQSRMRMNKLLCVRYIEMMMKSVFNFFSGALIAIAIMQFISYSYPNERDASIVIHVVNDTEEKVSSVILEIDDAQVFTCTLRYKKCSIAVLSSGDVSFTVKANMQSGKTRVGSIGYSEPGYTHSILISGLNEKTT